MKVSDPAQALFDAAQRVVDEHGWTEATRSLARAARDASSGLRPDRSDSALLPIFGVIQQVPQSAWTPILAPLLAAGLTTINQPQIDKHGAADDPHLRSMEIPDHDQPVGPMTRARQRRMAAIFASAQAAGIASVAAKAGPAREAWATGVMFPGAGFLYTRDPARFAVTMAAFALAGVLWFGTGNHIAPPLVWAGAAGLAARRATTKKKHWRWTPYAVAAILGLLSYEQARERRNRFRAQQKQAKAANELLRTATPPLRGDNRPPIHAADEMGDEALALTRRFVDTAMMPLDDWSEWDVIEQFQPAALRYQIDHLVYTLALQKFARTPAFRGYHDQAMRRLIDKYQQRKVWSYWAWENLWGNLEWNPDPARKQNIMLTGFFALSLGSYQTVTGDYRHSEPGSIEFVWNEKRRYPYSYDSLCASLTSDYLKSPWGLVVCEPNWIFSICNMRGAEGLMIHDRLHGSHYWEMIKDGYFRGMEQEFVRPDGMLNFYRSARTGIGQNGASFSSDLRPIAPHLADRGWTLLRAAFQERDGKLVTPLASRDKLLDSGNYSFHPLKSYTYIIDEAREAGDDEASVAAWDEIKNRVDMRIDDRGWLVVDGASVSSHIALSRALVNRKAGWLDMVGKGMPEEWRTGPQLESVPYPQALVARAVTDGQALEAVLRSTNGASRVSVELSQLRPGDEYAVTGAVQPTVTADDHGRATLEVDLDRRSELRVAPSA
jgi:Linalool dehydratase/isomerase